MTTIQVIMAEDAMREIHRKVDSLSNEELTSLYGALNNCKCTLGWEKDAATGELEPVFNLFIEDDEAEEAEEAAFEAARFLDEHWQEAGSVVYTASGTPPAPHQPSSRQPHRQTEPKHTHMSGYLRSGSRRSNGDIEV